MSEPLLTQSSAHDSAKPVPPVVGIGASAGGIKALKEFFSAVPVDSGAAYVVILHLSPEHESRLAQVLQTTARIPVTQVVEKATLEPDHIYVIKPNSVLETARGQLVPRDMSTSEQRRAPVDAFFRALADSHGHSAVGIVMSGTGTNGSSGLKRIKERGGLVLVQEPGEAELNDMPRNAIATGLVDLVLPVAEMPGRIVGYLRRPQTEEPEPAGAPADEGDAMREVLTLLRIRTGQDFANYKPATLQRRIERRMSLQSLPSVAAYADYLRQSSDEAQALMRELLISVTNFFRDAAAWEALERQVIPRLFANKSRGDQVRVWVPGCATGEEAYSLAILLAEHASASVDQPAIQLFATDLDERAINLAREGLYSQVDVVDVSEERLIRFFQREAAGYRVKRELREMILFARHNVLKDPPFSHLDLVSCRNLLIYLNRSIQERVIETFHFALRPGGYLFLGTSESPDGGSDLFLRVDANAHIYESRTVTSRLTLPLSVGPSTAPPAQSRTTEVRQTEKIMPADLHQRLLEQYAPPSVVISEDQNVIHMSERAGRFMELKGGELSRDLLTLVRAELRPDLRTALHKAAKARTAVDVKNIPVRLDDGEHRVDLSVRPVLREGDPPRGFYLVLFAEAASPAEQSPPPVTLTSPAEPIALQLEEELGRVRSQLRQTVEQYETQVEEAKAANEELQAMNEELRSSAEELETSKEELQSVNEELTTVNQELKIKIEELGLTNNDFQNFINATDIATIFVDQSIRVKFSTPSATAIFNLLDSDIGRRLTDITSRVKYTGIYDDVRTVLDKLQSIEREVETEDGRWHLMRLLPYRTSDNHIDGVVLTFQDITDRRRAEMRVRESEERLRLLIDSALDYAIFTMKEDGTIDSWNSGAERLFGYSADEVVGRSGSVLFTEEDRASGAHERELADARVKGRASDERYHVRKDGRRFFCSGITRRLGTGGIGFAKIARDLTAQREAADALEYAHSELEVRVRERTGALEHALEQAGEARGSVTRLLHRVVTAQEDERRRISRDLHDDLGQRLTSLRMTLERHQNACTASGAEISDALGATKGISDALDFLAWQLRPALIDELGLSAALEKFVAQWSGHVGIPAEVRCHDFTSGMLRPEVELAFYRIAQEALNNVAKHAGAARVDVLLSAGDGLVTLVIEDDGIGFEPAVAARTGGFGLIGIRERAALVGATVDIESSPGEGTALYVRSAITRAGATQQPPTD